jgi:hypothetical protein
MTDHADVEGAAQEALDVTLPRRDPRYPAALAYLTAYLQADAPTRRLAMRALKVKGIEADGAKEPA